MKQAKGKTKSAPKMAARINWVIIPPSLGILPPIIPPAIAGNATASKIMPKTSN